MDAPVFSVDFKKTPWPNWVRLEVRVENKTASTWTVRSIELMDRPGSRFVNGSTMSLFAGIEVAGWSPSDAKPVTKAYAVNRVVTSGGVETIHVYASPGPLENDGSSAIGAKATRALSTIKAVSRALAMGQPSLVHPTICRRSRLIVTIWSRNHARSFRWSKTHVASEIMHAASAMPTDK